MDPERDPLAACVDPALDEAVRGCRPGLGRPTTRDRQRVRVGVVGRHGIVHMRHCLQRLHSRNEPMSFIPSAPADVGQTGSARGS